MVKIQARKEKDVSDAVNFASNKFCVWLDTTIETRNIRHYSKRDLLASNVSEDTADMIVLDINDK